jgi:hypothetical protein
MSLAPASISVRRTEPPLRNKEGENKGFSIRVRWFACFLEICLAPCKKEHNSSVLRLLKHCYGILRQGGGSRHASCPVAKTNKDIKVYLQARS